MRFSLYVLSIVVTTISMQKTSTVEADVSIAHAPGYMTDVGAATVTGIISVQKMGISKRIAGNYSSRITKQYSRLRPQAHSSWRVTARWL